MLKQLEQVLQKSVEQCPECNELSLIVFKSRGKENFEYCEKCEMDKEQPIDLDNLSKNCKKCSVK